MVISLTRFGEDWRNVWLAENDNGPATRSNSYSSAGLDIRPHGALKDRDEVVGNGPHGSKSRPETRLAAPFKQVEFDINVREGISKMGEHVGSGVKAGVVDKSGPRGSAMGDERSGRGVRNGKTLFLKENIAMANEDRGQESAPLMGLDFAGSRPAMTRHLEA